jgi:hypothetical protein
VYAVGNRWQFATDWATQQRRRPEASLEVGAGVSSPLKIVLSKPFFSEEDRGQFQPYAAFLALNIFR